MFQFPKLTLSKDIALDWGSRNCYVWSSTHGFVAISSQVWVNERNQIQAWQDPKNANISRFKLVPTIKNGDITDFRLCIDYIGRVLIDTMDRLELAKPTVWISINSNAHQSEIEALEYVLTKGGAGKVRFLNQDIALAVRHKFDFQDIKTQFFLHIGHQQTLISVISASGFILERQHLFGGYNFDVAIQDYIRRVYRVVISLDDVVNIKKLLNQHKQRIEIWGRDLVSDRIKSIELDYGEIWNQTKPQVEDLGNLIKNFIHDLPPELINDIVDNGIILSGGSSQYGRLKEFLQIKLGVNLYLASEPKLAVIQGLQQIITHQREYLQSRFA